MNNPWKNAYNHPNFAGYNKEQIDEMLMCELEEIYSYEQRQTHMGRLDSW